MKKLWIAEVYISGQRLKAEFKGIKDNKVFFQIIGHDDIREIPIPHLISVEEMEFE